MKWWILFFVALALGFGIFLYSTPQIHETQILPTPLDARPIVRSRLSDKHLAIEKKDLSEERKILLEINLYSAMERLDLEDTSVEYLESEEFIQAVDDWCAEFPSELGMDVTDQDLQYLGESHLDLASPYGRYLAMDWATRYGASMNYDRIESLIERIADDQAVHMAGKTYDEEDEPDESNYYRVHRILGDHMVETFIRRLWNNLKKEEKQKIIDRLKYEESDGHKKVLKSINSWENIP
jgi:hypothetical protein